MKVAHIFANTSYEPRARKFIRTLEEDNQEVLKILKKEGENYPKFVWNTIKRLLKEKPEWVHSHRISGYITAIIYKLLNWKSKIIYDKHDIHKLDFIFDKLLFFAKYVFVCSELHLKELNRRNVIRIPNYSTFKPVSEERIREVRRELELKEGDIFILFQGSIIKEYGLEMAIKAMNKIKEKNIKLIILGWIKDEEYWNKLKKNFSDNIIYAGTRKFEEMNDYVGSADIGLVLFQKSRLTINGDPNKLYEFLNCKVPIISTNLGYMKDLFKKYGGGVSVKNEEELVEKILLLSNEKVITNWNISWENIKDKYLEILKN